MQTRARAKAQTVPSSGNPVSPLEGQGQRPPSMASEEEGDLGLVSLLGEGAVSDVGGNYTCVSASSGPGDVTVVAAQAPILEVEVTSSNGQIEVGSTDPLLSTVRTTRLPDLQTQAAVRSTQVPPLSLGRGSEPVQLPSLHPTVEARIPTLFSEGPGGQAKLDEWPASTSAFSHVKSVEHDYRVACNVNEMYWDENIDPYSTRNVTCRPMRGALHASVPFTDLPPGIDRSRTFRPLDRGYGRIIK